MTLLDARNQKSSGFDEKQAESVVETINKAVNETVATKADLALLRTEIANLETRMMRMMWLQLMVMVSMFVTVVVTLP